MITRTIRVCVVLAVVHCSVRAGEIFVDQGAAGGGDGSAARPMQSIAKAVAAAKGGDVITVRKGVYCESLALDKSGTAQQPTVLRAAAGERVVLSGFAPVKGWQAHRDNIHTTVIDGTIDELFVGHAMQAIARWPDVNQAWRYVKRGDVAGTIRDRDAMPGDKALAEVAANPAGARIYLYVGTGNFFRDCPLSKLEVSSGTLTTSQPKSIETLKGQKDRFGIINHAALIKGPGQWACEPVDGKRTRVYFWPANAEDLQRTQFRQCAKPMVYIGHWKNTTSHVRIEGFEVTGSDSGGIQLGRAEHVAVARCIVHHNAGTGISARRCNNIEIAENISFANGNGIGIASSKNVVVQRNEIALNMVDGLTVAGNVSGKPDGEPTTSDVVVRRNYMHHHLLLGHPDNMQTYRDVERLTIEENVLLFGGQGIMTEETNRSVLRNCVVVGTGAVAVIFGHSNASDWVVEQCTIGLGGWGALSMTAKNYQLNHNIFFNNGHGLGETIAADFNLYATNSEKQVVAIVSKPKHKAYTKLEEAAGATGQQKHSLIADPKFRNAPARQAMVIWHDENTRERLFIRQPGATPVTEGFAVGDLIEINGDGVPRRLTAVDDKTLRFEPAIPQLLLRDGLIWNWKSVKNTTPDFRPGEGSKALSAGQDGKRVGSSLDVPAFGRGDFDGDGKRDIPELPEDLKASWPNPNGIVLPMHGS